MILEVIRYLTEYTKLLAAGASSFDTIRVEDQLSKFENRDTFQSYFLTCNFEILRIYTRYSNNLEDLLDLANSICTNGELQDLAVTIFQTTEYGGKAIYNHSNLGMIYQEK